MGMLDVATLLSRLGLTHLEIHDDDIHSLLVTLEHSGRVALLKTLKASGVSSISERQTLANGLGRYLREGEEAFIVESPPPASSAPSTADAFGFDPYMYAEVLVPRERAVKGRARRPHSMGKLGAHVVLGTPLLPAWPLPSTHRRAILAAGCFWGLEKGLWRLPGVISTAVGYALGHTQHPSYSEVCTGLTGHTEAVLVVYDAEAISFADLLRWFFQCHDPCQGMGQGKDRGTQYRSAIVTFDEDQLALALASREAYQRAIRSCGRSFTAQQTITVQVVPPLSSLAASSETPRAGDAPPPPPAAAVLVAAAAAAGGAGGAPPERFYYAEEYHMQYLARPGSTPYCTAQPLMVSLPPYETWAPPALSPYRLSLAGLPPKVAMLLCIHCSSVTMSIMP